MPDWFLFAGRSNRTSGKNTRNFCNNRPSHQKPFTPTFSPKPSYTTRLLHPKTLCTVHRFNFWHIFHQKTFAPEKNTPEAFMRNLSFAPATRGANSFDKNIFQAKDFYARNNYARSLLHQIPLHKRNLLRQLPFAKQLS